MIASLMMYQRPELDAALGDLWQAIRGALCDVGIDAPEGLSQEAEEFTVWRAPDLVLSQTCGMPYRLWLHETVDLVGTPDYGLPGCAPGYYRSALVVRHDDPRQDLRAFQAACFAFNQTFSQSGFAAAYWHTQPLGFFFANRVQTDQHLASARAVARGRADIAAIDAVTWRNIERFEPMAKALRVLDWTAPTPGLPLITARGRDTAALFDAVAGAIAGPGAAAAATLGLNGMIRIPKDAYLRVPNPPGPVAQP